MSPSRRGKMERMFPAPQPSLIRQRNSSSNVFRSQTICGSMPLSKTLRSKRMDSNLASKLNSTKLNRTKSPSANRSQLPKSEAVTTFTITGAAITRRKNTLSFCRECQSTLVRKLPSRALRPNRT